MPDLGQFAHLHFLRPWWLLMLLPALLVFLGLRFQQSAAWKWRAVIAPHLLEHLVVKPAGRSNIRPLHLLAVLMVVAALALAGPSWRREPPPFTQDTAPLVLALDLSASMLVEDIQPSRLERAKQKGADILAGRKGAPTALPKVVYHWWDLERGTLKKEVLPAVTLTVVPNPDLAAEHLGEKPLEEETAAVVDEGEDNGIGWWITGLALAAFLLIRFFGRRLARLWAAGTEYRRTRAESEARYFERFHRAAKTGDPAGTMTALMAWLDRAAGPGAATLQQFVEWSADPELAAQAEALSATLYGGAQGAGSGATPEAWSGRRFARLAARARNKMLSGSGDAEPVRAALPPLNPGAGMNL